MKTIFLLKGDSQSSRAVSMTWLCCYIDGINAVEMYIMLNSAGPAIIWIFAFIWEFTVICMHYIEFTLNYDTKPMLMPGVLFPGHMLHHVNIGLSVKQCVHQIPSITMEASIQPITRTVLRVRLIVTPDFRWSDQVNKDDIYCNMQPCCFCLLLFIVDIAWTDKLKLKVHVIVFEMFGLFSVAFSWVICQPTSFYYYLKMHLLLVHKPTPQMYVFNTVQTESAVC